MIASVFLQKTKALLDEASLRAVILFVFLCSLFGLLAPLYWFFDLFNHFRPQALLAGVVLLLPIALHKNKKLLCLALMVIALNAGLMASRLYSFHAAPIISGDAPSLTLISANIKTSNRDFLSIIQLVQEQQPDMFLVLEVDDAWVAALSTMEVDYPYSVKHARTDNFGIALYAKKPFTADIAEIGAFDIPLLTARFDNVTLLGLHPVPPAGGEANVQMAAYFGAMTKTLATTTGAVIVAGDMNATLWSNDMTYFKEAALTPARWRPFEWTWPHYPLPFGIRIDHVFARHAVIDDYQVLRDVGSDHYPVKATLRLGD